MANYVDRTPEEARKAEAAKKRDPKFHNSRWWMLEDAQLPGAITSIVHAIRQSQYGLELTRQFCSRLYGDQNPTGWFGLTFNRANLVNPALSGRITFNVIAIVVDTLVSKITRNRVRPMFLTSGGNYRQQRRAKKLTQFCDGIFYEAKVDELAPEIFRDAMIDGHGIVHIYPDPTTERISFERIVSSELYVGEQDGFYRNPREMYRVTNIDRMVLHDAYPAHAEMILNCQEQNVQGKIGTVDNADQVTVIEAWHLPSSKEAVDGRHTIAIQDGVLLNEVYEKQRFPFSVFRWKTRKNGWHGKALVEELMGTQVEINYLLYLITRSIKMMGSFKIAVENSSMIPDTHLTDQVGAIIHFDKTPPQYIAPNPVPAQYFSHLEMLKNQAFQIARVSQLSASGQKPAGLNSGEAQRVYHDIEEQGFAATSQAYEAFHLDMAELAIDVVRDLATSGVPYKVRANVGSKAIPGRTFLSTIDWKKVALKQDEYITKAFPVSVLPSTPAGRMASVQELAANGWIDQSTAIRLLDFPDLPAAENLLTAQEEWISMVMDKIIEDGDYSPPDPFMDLQMARRICHQEIALGSTNDLEEDRLDLLRTFIAQIDDLNKEAQLAAQAELVAQQAAQAPPQAPPAAAPETSTAVAEPIAPPVSPT